MPAPLPAVPPVAPPAPVVPPVPGQDIATLQGQVKDLGTQLEQMQPFIDDASVLISAIYQNPELRTQAQTAVTQLATGTPPPAVPLAIPPATSPTIPPATPPAAPVPGQPPAPTIPPTVPKPGEPPVAPVATAPPSTNPRYDSVDMKMRDDVVKQIETKYGYNNLKGEDRKILRQQVENKMNQWNTSVFTAPVHQLGKMLEDAYLLSDVSKAKEQGRLEGLVDARSSDMGALPSMGTQQLTPPDTVLTAEHKDWAKKMGVAEDRVALHLKELTEKGVVTYKPKAVPAATTQPVPSGMPTPPAPTPAAPAVPATPPIAPAAPPATPPVAPPAATPPVAPATT